MATVIIYDPNTGEIVSVQQFYSGKFPDQKNGLKHEFVDDKKYEELFTEDVKYVWDKSGKTFSKS